MIRHRVLGGLFPSAGSLGRALSAAALSCGVGSASCFAVPTSTHAADTRIVATASPAPPPRTAAPPQSAAAPRAPSALPSQDKFHLRPGAQGKLCLGCHADFQDLLNLPSVHTPVKAGDCTDCHSPHASSHGKLLAADPNKICAGCHSGIVPDNPASAHPAALAGACVKCHDPHGSKNKNNLLLAGNELCYSCHKPMQAAVMAAAFKHAPLEKGCLTCHTPHGSSKSSSLLKSDVPGLCLSCHRAELPSFTARHMGYPVAKADCTSCHDPHGSSSPGLLWANVHKPVAGKMCSQCHEDASSPNVLRTRKAGLDLCRGCHGSLVNETLASNRVHWPVLDETSCQNCHNPHAAREKGLLAKPMKALCGRCHADTIRRQARSLTKHPPIEEGDCTACHSPHASGGVFLLSNPSVIELCGTCHDWQKHSTHPIGEKVVDKRNRNLTMDCLSCHRTHGTPYKYLAHYDPKADLCVQCHEELKR